jgi:Uma2 family endonuclease
MAGAHCKGTRRAERREVLCFDRHNEAATMNVAVTTAAEGFPRRVFTVDDISRMMEAGVIGEDEKFELIEGEIVMMAAKGIAHERIKSALTVAIARALPDRLTMGVEVTLRLTNNNHARAGHRRFSQGPVQQIRDGVRSARSRRSPSCCEVAASSIAYYKSLKARLYARQRVRELWVVDANERITWVHTGPNGDEWSSIVQRGTRSPRRRCLAF